jgi:DNA-binding CsgD family transcriptional regulator
VLEAIRAAHDVEVRLDPAVAKLLAERLRRRPESAPVDPLTGRELDVLGLLGRGLSNKVIAAELGIADCTVRTHVSNVLGKLGLLARAGCALRYRAGIRRMRCRTGGWAGHTIEWRQAIDRGEWWMRAMDLQRCSAHRPSPVIWPPGRIASSRMSALEVACWCRRELIGRAPRS